MIDTVMIDTVLVNDHTVVTAKGDSDAIDLSGAASRAFLLTLSVVNIIEQESIEISIFGSADGASWDVKPLVTYPQQFYRGQYPMLLELNGHPDVKFVRAHWEVARWGRGTESPMFEFGLRIKEIPPDILRQTSVEAKATA